MFLDRLSCKPLLRQDMDGSHMRLCPLPVSASLSTADTSPILLRCWFIKAKDITSPKHISLSIWDLKASAPKVLSSYLYILFLWISFTPDFQLSTLNEDSLIHSVAPIHFPSFYLSLQWFPGHPHFNPTQIWNTTYLTPYLKFLIGHHPNQLLFLS